MFDLLNTFIVVQFVAKSKAFYIVFTGLYKEPSLVSNPLTLSTYKLFENFYILTSDI